MYESPINAYFGEVKTQFDGAVFKAVQSVGIDVKKDELIKALAYDRDQYERGYYDGLMFRPLAVTNGDKIRAMTDEELADFLCDIGECDRRCPAKIGDCIFSDSTCRGAWLDWLKQEAE